MNRKLLKKYSFWPKIGQYYSFSTSLGLEGGGAGGGPGGGGVQGNFFWSSRFELWAPQVPLIIRETFGEILGPRRATVSEPRPAHKLGVR